MRFQTRNDIMKWLETNAPTRGISRALLDGQNEFLGGFSSTNSFSHPCWIIKVISKFRKMWYVSVFPNLKHNRYSTCIINDVPWEYWIGDTSTNPLYQGDNPDEYRRLKNGQTKKYRSH